jgi:signal transduction histidine kinase
MSLTSERKLPIILTFVFFILTVVGLLSYQSTISVRDELGRQKRTRDVLIKLDDTLTNSVDIDTAVMGFIITGSQSYLEPISRADKSIAGDMAELDSLTAADGQQDAEFENLKRLVEQKSQTTRDLIELRRTTNFETAVAQLPVARSQTVSSDFRGAIERLKSREMELLGEHEDAVDESMSRTILILIISSLAGIAALVFANYIVMLENHRRRRAETALIRANEELEQKVEARTKQLQSANENLLESAAERETLLANEKAARREAEIANRLRDEFMATISHELRTPLNSILGWARLLNNGNLEARQSAKAVRTIIKNSESQNRLIEDLLDVARMISGKLQLEQTQVSVRDFLENSIETVKPEASERNVKISLNVEGPAETQFVTGDRVRLEQIITNLLTNAVKFSKPEGNVELTAAMIGDAVEIAVVDHGVGIKKEFLPLVFERFRQDRSTIKESGGLGLGLAVVRNLTELHGGSVSAQSDGEGNGSTFVVRLPVSRAASA